MLGSPPLGSPLSLTGKLWRVQEGFPRGSDAREIVAYLANLRGIDVQDVRSADAFATAQIFPDFSRAAERLRHALQEKEQIGVFADYDCDGLTGAAQMIHFLRRVGSEPAIELPNRLTEGYGLTEEMIGRFRERGVRLLFAIDAGITAAAAVALAASAGIDVVILDHHALPEALPKAHAILHPALAAFPGAHPCAAGVTHLFVRGCEEYFREPMSETERMHLRALAAIGTVADLVPLTGWNRALVREGVDALRRMQTGPLAAFVQAVQARGETLTARDIAFRIAPRINAAGRMEDPSIALAALLGSPSALHALETINSARQELSGDLTEEAIAMIEGQPKSPFLVLVHDECTAGVMGLVAGKLVERFGRPALVASVFGEQCRASLRGIPGHDVTAALRRAAHLLTNFGGHAQAAGCTFPRAHADALREILSSHVLENIPEEELLPCVRIDAAIGTDDLSLSLAGVLHALEPFGQGNPEPRFLLEHVELKGARSVGAEGNHLHCRIGTASGIGFRLGHLLQHAAEPLDLAFRLTVDTWNGLRRAKAVIEDIRVPAGAAKLVES